MVFIIDLNSLLVSSVYINLDMSDICFRIKTYFQKYLCCCHEDMTSTEGGRV